MQGGTINDTTRQQRQEPRSDDATEDVFSFLPGYRFWTALADRISTLYSRPVFKHGFRGLLTVLFVILVNKSIARADVADLIRTVSPGMLAGVLMLGAGSFYFQVLRWRCILWMHAFPSSMGVAVRTMFRGFFLGFVTPGRLGELFRAIHLDPTRKLATAAATVEERLCAVVVTVVAGAVAMLVQIGVLHRPLFLPLVVASVFFTVMVLLALLFLKYGKATTPDDTTPLGRVRSFLKNPERGGKMPVFRLAGYSFAAHLLLLLQTGLLFFMFGERDFLINLLVAAQAYAFMLLLPFFIANIGLREFAFSFFLLRATTISTGELATGVVALGSATIILFVNIILPAAIGLIWGYLEKQADQRIATKEDNDDAT